MIRRLFSLSLAPLALLAPVAAGAEEISFDEVPAANSNAPPLGEEYAALGVHFLATDDGSVWTGLSGGDPGGWSLEGTNGTAFVGFNGASYALQTVFDRPVRDVRIDVARAAGSRPGDSLVLRGRRGGQLVEEVSVVLGDVNVWTTVALAEEVDAVEWVGVGSRRHPYGVDNLRWSAEAATIAVGVDVKPGGTRNRVNPFAQGVVPVALLGGEAVEVAEIDVTSLAFGPLGAPALRPRVRDVNRDGYPDLVGHYRIPETGIAFGDAEACLVGETLEGTPLAGCDVVETVPVRWRAPYAPDTHPGHVPAR